MANPNSKLSILTNGIIKENPVLRLVLGTCPTLAVTTSAVNGIGMGLSTMFVLICSNMVISALRKVIPDKVHLPAFITIIAAFVTILQMVIKAYFPSLNSALGVYLSLIVVNCIILGRAEMFASKHNVVESALDGVGMGIGFTLTLFCMGAIREVLGSGTIFGLSILPASLSPMTVFVTPPGGFFVYGIIMAAVVYVEIKTNNRKKRTIGCEGCPGCDTKGSGCEGCEKGSAE